MKLPNNIDIHTHTGPIRPDAVLCIDPTQCDELPAGNGLLSVGIHPWNAGNATTEVWRRMALWLNDPRVIAVGEIGLDRIRGPKLDEQISVFQRQMQMACSLEMPIIIHCVRAYDVLLGLGGGMNVQRVVHGFRGKPELARQLLAAGFDLSFGRHYNEEAYAITPDDRRYRETDTL